MGIQNMPQPKQQRGMVLVIALILVLVLTLLGVTAMRMTTLETKMAGYHKNGEKAFQVAEAALRQGEQDIQKGNTEKVIEEDELLHFPQAWKENEGKEKPLKNDYGIDAGYIIERIPSGPTIYRITARAEGPTGGPVMLQSTYAPVLD